MSDAFTRDDTDLMDVLNQAEDEELTALSAIISEKLTSSIEADCTDPIAIARELQHMGGNSFNNLRRGYGVHYQKLAYEAAKKSGVKGVTESSSIEKLEMALVEYLANKAFDSMDQEQMDAFFKDLKENGHAKAGTRKQLMAAFAKGAISGDIARTLTALIMSNVLRDYGYRAAAMFVAGRASTAWIPVVGWAVAIGSVAHSMSGAAFTVTIPCTAYIGMIRLRIKAEAMEL